MDIPAGLFTANNANTVQLICDGTSNQDVRVNWIALTAEVAAALNNPHEAENATLPGGALGGSGTFVASMDKLGAVCQWTAIQSPVTGSATLPINGTNWSSLPPHL